MNTIAIMLDGGPWNYHPPLPLVAAAYTSPILTLVSCCIIARNYRFSGYAYLLASAVTGFLVIPLYQAVINAYDDAYALSELIQFWFLVAFPFLAIFLFAEFLRTSPKPVPEPARFAQDGDETMV